MTIHYHGTPISPRSILQTMGGKCFCVSFAAGQDVEICHQIGQSVMLDNGAFTFWRTGRASDWVAFYDWAEPWLDYPTTWAIIPDYIDGDTAENDRLVSEWPHGEKNGSPVWHMHEPIERLLSLCQSWGRVCFGSSGQYATVGDDRWRGRADDAFNALSRVGKIPWIHMLRGMALAGSEYPFASVDSTDIARNHNRGVPARKMADRWDALQCPATWKIREQLSMEVVR